MPRCPCASWKGKPVDTQLDAGPWHGSRSHLGKALVDVVSDPLSEELDLDVCLPNSGHLDERHSAHFERYGQVRIWQFGFAFTTSSRNSNQ